MMTKTSISSLNGPSISLRIGKLQKDDGITRYRGIAWDVEHGLVLWYIPVDDPGGSRKHN
jgi:hypothetical protein